MNRAVILFILAIAAGASAADKKEVYKWTDANGVVHFTDAPPPTDTKNVQTLRLIGGTSSETPVADANAPAQDKAKAVAGPDSAKECEQAKRNLALLQSNYSVSELGPDGKVKPIDDKERAGRIAGVNDRIAQFCAK